MNRKNLSFGVEYFCYFMVAAGYFLFPWKLNQGIALVGIGFLLWLFNNKKNPMLKEWIKDPLTILLVFFLMVCIVRTQGLPAEWSASVADSISRYYKYIFSIIAIAVMRKPVLRKFAMNAFFVSVFIIVTSMHLNIFWNLPWSNPTLKGWGHDQTVVGDYITQNLFVNIFIILALDFCIKSKNIYSKIFFGIAALMGAHAMLFLSIGRTGYLLLTISLVSYAFWAIHSKWKWLALILIPIAACLAIYSSEYALQRVQQAVTEARNAVSSIEGDEIPDNTSIGARIYMWNQSWNIISQKPITGWGVGSYPQRWCETVPEVWCNETAKHHPHNQYLMFWMELGLTGLLIYISTIIYLTYRGMRDKVNGGVLVALMMMLIVDGFINSPLYVRREYQLFLLMIPLIYSCLNTKSDIEVGKKS